MYLSAQYVSKNVSVNHISVFRWVICNQTFCHRLYRTEQKHAVHHLITHAVVCCSLTLFHLLVRDLHTRVRVNSSSPIHRAEPILTRMKEDHTRIILPAIDNIKYNTFEVQQYANAAHGYNWGLWCMYIIPPQEWLDKGDETAPIR